MRSPAGMFLPPMSLLRIEARVQNTLLSLFLTHPGITDGI